MPKTKEQKQQELDALTTHLKANEYGVVTDFEGLTMVDLDQFRAKAREQGVKYTVVKTSLLDLAAKNAGLDGITTIKTGRNYAIALGGKDEVSISKLLNQFAKDSDGRVNITAGIISGEVVPSETVQRLALLPSYEELLAKFVGSLNAPISNFVYSLNYTQQSFYNVIKAIQESKN